MGNLIKFSLVMAVLLAIFVPGVYGITVGTQSGDAGGQAVTTMTVKAPTNSEVSSSLTVTSGSKVTQAITGSGSLSEEHIASTADGSTAAVSAEWSNSSYYDYAYDLIPKEGKTSPYAQATETLNVTDPLDLYVYAGASNKEGDNAFSSVYAGSGYKLKGYTNRAKADKSSASASQSFDFESAYGLIGSSEAYNDEGDMASSVVTADYGTLGGYASSATAGKSKVASSQSANYAALANVAAEAVPVGQLSKATATQDSSIASPVNKGSSATHDFGDPGFFSIAGSKGGSTVTSWMSVWDNYLDEGTGTLHIFNGYLDSGKADSSSASISQSTKSAYGEWIQWGGSAWNAEGDSSETYNGFWAGMLNGYSGTESSAISSATTSQSIASVASTYYGYYGSGQAMDAYGYNAEGDYVHSYLSNGIGIVNGETTSTVAKKSSATASLGVASESGDYLYNYIYASNSESDISVSRVASSYGTVASFTGKANSAKASVDSTASIKGFEGKGFDIYSLASNTVSANEGLDELVNYGGVDFEFGAKNKLGSVAVKNTASLTKGLTMTPTLPSGTKTAILIEPFLQYALNAGGNDTRYTVMPALASSGYGVIRYTDSAATKDKIKSGLDKYNIVMIKSHMNSETIGLSVPSTSPGYVKASEIKYGKPPAKSLVIMAGCESFQGYPTASKLATAVSKASLRAGYQYSVSTAWNQDYMGALFTQMAQGKTFEQANDYVYNVYRYTWAADHGFDPEGEEMCKLLPYGNENFKL